MAMYPVVVVVIVAAAAAAAVSQVTCGMAPAIGAQNYPVLSICQQHSTGLSLPAHQAFPADERVHCRAHSAGGLTWVLPTQIRLGVLSGGCVWMPSEGVPALMQAGPLGCTTI
jgi:hypothetical protein